MGNSKDNIKITVRGDGMSERIHIELSAGISLAGFFIGTGLVIAASILAGKL